MAPNLSDSSYNWYSKYIVNSSPTFKYEDYNFVFNPSSNFAKENLYHIKLIVDVHAELPFYCTLNKFNSYCILYSSNCNGKLHYRNHVYPIRPNSVLFIDCNFAHKIELTGIDQSDFQVAYLNGNNIHYLYNLFVENDFFTCSLQASSDIPFIFRKLFKCCKQNSKYSELIISSLVANLLTSLLLNRERNLNSSNNAPKYILDIKSLLDHNYDHSYSLNELAKQYNINKYKLVRDFTNYISISPINYLIKRRIEIAKKLLKTTTLSINEISYSVGIQNPNHFINLFKKTTNATPLSYRKLHESDVIAYLEN